MVEVKHQFVLSVAEARALVAVCEGGIPELFPKGSATRLGLSLWNALVCYKLAVPMGSRGRGARAGLDHDRFDAVKFVIARERRNKQARWKDIRGAPMRRAKGEWLEDLRRQLGVAEAHPASAAAAAAPAREPAPDLAGARALLEVVRADRERALNVVRDEARPFLERLEAAQAAVNEVESALANLDRATAHIAR